VLGDALQRLVGAAELFEHPGWLDKLVECAETTGAWIVGPMYLIGEPGREEIHLASGDARVEEGPTGRRFVERHRFAGKRLADIRAHLVRMPCELVEFHCMLVRTGGEVYFEPDSIVTYITGGRFSWADYAFYFWRWADA
jgi:hypothetical protein